MVLEIMTALVQQVNVTGNATLPALPAIQLENIFGDLTSTLILLTLMVAVTVRQSTEFIEKLRNGEINNFNPKYAVQGIIAFISSFPIAVGLMGGAASVFLAYFGTLGLAGALIMVAVYGYGWTHGVNKLSSLVGHFFTAKNGSTGSITGVSQEPQTSPPSAGAENTPPPTPDKDPV